MLYPTIPCQSTFQGLESELGARQLGYNCLQASRLHTHGRMYTTVTMYACP